MALLERLGALEAFDKVQLGLGRMMEVKGDVWELSLWCPFILCAHKIESFSKWAFSN